MLCTFLVSNAQETIKEGWSFYQDEGKWGVLYKGKPCLLPRFNEICGTIDEGRFIYKENNKYGISTVWKEVTKPFCDSLVFIKVYSFFHSMAKYKINDKWGVCSLDGTQILPAVYKEINDTVFQFYNIFLENPQKKLKKNKLPDINYYFIVDDGVSHKIIDLVGKIIINEVVSYSQFNRNRKKNKSIIKLAQKEEWNRKSEKELEEVDKRRSDIGKGYISTTLRAEMQKWNWEYCDLDKRYKDMREPRKLYFGFTPISGDTAIVDGFESIVNSYGFISTPIMYDSPYFVLKNDPTNIQSMLYILEMEEIQKGKYFRTKDQTIFFNEDDIRNGVIKEDMIRMEKRLEDYQSIINLAKQINDTLSFKTVNSKYKKLHSLLQDFEFYYDKNVKRINFNDRMDRFANTTTSILNSIANTIGGNSLNTMSYNTTSNNSSTSNASASTKGNQMSMSDQMNYNSMRNTYNKWAQDLMQMKNANGKYQNGFKASDKKHAQDEMKRIRKSAIQKWNKEIPYNSIEDW